MEANGPSTSHYGCVVVVVVGEIKQTKTKKHLQSNAFVWQAYTTNRCHHMHMHRRRRPRRATSLACVRQCECAQDRNRDCKKNDKHANKNATRENKQRNIKYRVRINRFTRRELMQPTLELPSKGLLKQEPAHNAQTNKSHEQRQQQ